MCIAELVVRWLSPQPLPPGPDRLLSKDVMGCREEAKFKHNSSHDRSTNAAIQERVSLKQTCFTVHVRPVYYFVMSISTYGYFYPSEGLYHRIVVSIWLLSHTFAYELSGNLEFSPTHKLQNGKT